MSTRLMRGLALGAGIALLLSACAEEEPGAATTPSIVATSAATTSAAPIATSTTGVVTTAQPETSTTSVTSTTSTSTTLPIAETELQLTEIARGFEQPVLAISPPEDARLYVVDQPGRIWVVDGAETELFVDLREDVIFGGERGLLGLAFHPDFASNGRFFVNYIGDRGETRVVELHSEDGGRSADPASQQILLQIDQPARNHNGGMIAFGPDGHLWVATGDGGGADDRFGQGQRTDTLLAALLRLDVTTPGSYSIPEGNPFGEGGGAPELYSFGLRNPWRFAFDGADLYIADVGQRSVEEINVLSVEAARGANFGWPIFEGSACFSGPCDTQGTVLPVAEYGHREGCSITGGFVYRGATLPQLTGHYFYGDFCNGWIRSLAPGGDTIEWFAPSGSRATTSFGQDASGEIYVVVRNGSVFRIEPAQ